jgi:hypothetical protein
LPSPPVNIDFSQRGKRFVGGFFLRTGGGIAGIRFLRYVYGKEYLFMSTFTEEITLVNAGDIRYADDGVITDAKIRRIKVDAMVDTGAWTLVINEETRAALGLKLNGSVFSSVADGKTEKYAMTEGIEFSWKNRKHILPAVLVPNAKYILFGALPMEALDVYADPVDECLKGRHGDEPLYILC